MRYQQPADCVAFFQRLAGAVLLLVPQEYTHARSQEQVQDAQGEKQPQGENEPPGPKHEPMQIVLPRPTMA